MAATCLIGIEQDRGWRRIRKPRIRPCVGNPRIVCVKVESEVYTNNPRIVRIMTMHTKTWGGVYTYLKGAYQCSLVLHPGAT